MDADIYDICLNVVVYHDTGDECDGERDCDVVAGGCGACRRCEPGWYHLRDKFGGDA